MGETIDTTCAYCGIEFDHDIEHGIEIDIRGTWYLFDTVECLKAFANEY